MKRLVLASIALAALPLTAAQTQSTQTSAQTSTQPATTTSAPAPTPAVADSPLVAASKAKGKRKATIVITNDSLLKSGGHITTTATQAPLPHAGTRQTEEQILAARDRKEREAKAAAARLDAEKKTESLRDAYVKKVLANAQDATPESIFSDDDPAAAEHRAEQATTTDTSGQKKPPQE